MWRGRATAPQPAKAQAASLGAPCCARTGCAPANWRRCFGSHGGAAWRCAVSGNPLQRNRSGSPASHRGALTRMAADVVRAAIIGLRVVEAR